MGGPRPRALVVGDVIDDIVVVPSGPIRADTDTISTITRTPGGSASNTAAWLGWHGAAVDFVGCVGEGERDTHAAAFGRSGVTPHLAEVAGRGTGTIVIVVDGDTRTMLTDRGANAALHLDQVTDALLAGASVLHLTGYSLVDGFTADELGSLIDRAHRHGVRVSLDPGSTGFIGDYGVERFRAAVRDVDLLLPAIDEARLLAGLPDASAVQAATALLDLAPVVMLTDSARAVVVADRDGHFTELAVEWVPTVDPTGAGDAFTAGVLAALLEGRVLDDAARQGMRAAAVAVGRAGGRPPVA